MATIVDALWVTLGLDASSFEAGSKQAVASLRQTETEAGKTARELQARGPQASEFFDVLKSSALGFMGVFLGSAGITTLIKDATSSMASLGREAANIGVSVPALDAFAKAIERNGGNAETARQSMLNFVNQMEQFNITGDSPIARWLNPIGAVRGENGFVVFDKFVKFAQEHKDDVPLINLVGKNLGYTQDMINEARRGVNQFRADLAESQRIGVVQPEMVERAQGLQRSFEGVVQAMQNIVNLDVSAASPALSEFLNTLKEFIINHKGTAEVILGISSALLALQGLRFVAFISGLGGISAALGGIVAFASGVGELAAGIGLLYEAITPSSTQTPQQERDLINQARIANGEAPDNSPLSAQAPSEYTAGGNWGRRFISSLPDGPARDYLKNRYGSNDVADTAMTPVQKAILQTIGEHEASGYNVRNGGSTFDDFSQHPVGIGPKGTSTAAGKYQIIQETWDKAKAKLNLPDFSPTSQDRAAIWIAETDYHDRTGGNLEADFAAGLIDKFGKALSPTWSSLPYGKQPRISPQELRDLAAANLARNQAPAVQPVPTTAPPVATAPKGDVSFGNMPRYSPSLPSLYSGYDFPKGAIPNASPAMLHSSRATPPSGPTTTHDDHSTDFTVHAINITTQAKDSKEIADNIARTMSDRIVVAANRGLA